MVKSVRGSAKYSTEKDRPSVRSFRILTSGSWVLRVLRRFVFVQVIEIVALRQVRSFIFMLSFCSLDCGVCWLPEWISAAAFELEPGVAGARCVASGLGDRGCFDASSPVVESVDFC